MAQLQKDLGCTMRIAFWSTSYFKSFGGAERIVNDILRHLSVLNIELFLIADKIRKGQLNNCYFEPLPVKVRVYQNTFPNPLLFQNQPVVFVFKLLIYIKASSQLAFFFLRNKIDIVHLHLVNIDVLLLVLYKYIFNYRLVITFTGVEIVLAERGFLSRLKMSIALKHADRVTAVSMDICRSLKKKFAFPDAIYIRNGINFRQINRIAAQNSISIRKDSFIYCGRLHPVKRISFMIDAFHGCLKAGCRNQLYIVGDGEEMGKAKDLIEQYAIEDRIILMGALDHSNAIQVMSQGKCLLLSSWSEGCPLVVLEAMALGKLVIAPDVGGLKDIVSHGENGYLYPVNRKEIFSELIMMVEGNPAIAAKMGAKAKVMISRKVDLSDTIQKYLSVYKSI